MLGMWVSTSHCWPDLRAAKGHELIISFAVAIDFFLFERLQEKKRLEERCDRLRQLHKDNQNMTTDDKTVCTSGREIPYLLSVTYYGMEDLWQAPHWNAGDADITFSSAKTLELSNVILWKPGVFQRTAVRDAPAVKVCLSTSLFACCYCNIKWKVTWTVNHTVLVIWWRVSLCRAFVVDESVESVTAKIRSIYVHLDNRVVDCV